MAKARCTCAAHAPFEPFEVQRRELGPRDVLIDIAFTGICHSDIHYAYDEFGRTTYPLVPGHEIAGSVAAVGHEVTRFVIGDRVGVGVMVDSCRTCPACLAGQEQYCSGQRIMTYNSVGRDGKPTYGGYSEKIVVDENYVILIPEAISLEQAAPMFCAGVTVYSPLRHWNAGSGKKVAILGIGGLGHLGVQIAAAMGAEVVALDISEGKRADALRLGATDFRLVTAPETFGDLKGSIDLIISTVPVDIDLDQYLGLLALDGVFVNTGVPPKPLSVDATNLLNNRRSLSGTRSGGIAETQEMMDFCAYHGVAAETETIRADQIDEAYDRVLRGDVKFRFVIDASTF